MNIIQVYKKLKNADGLLTTNELNIITYGLISQKIRKKIIQICGSVKDKLKFPLKVYRKENGYLGILSYNKILSNKLIK